MHEYVFTYSHTYQKRIDMHVISILNQKGGCGKTTLSTNLCCAFHRKGNSVVLVDSDPQGSARDWHHANEENPISFSALDRPNNFRTLRSTFVGHDYVIIDGAAKFSDISAAAVKASDTVLIPVQPSQYDIWAVNDLVEIVKARQELTEGPPKAAFVISRAIQNTKLGTEVLHALAEHEFPIFASRTVQRQVYPQTVGLGLSVFDSSNKEAISEISSIADELLRFIDGEAVGQYEVRRVENA